MKCDPGSAGFKVRTSALYVCYRAVAADSCIGLPLIHRNDFKNGGCQSKETERLYDENHPKDRVALSDRDKAFENFRVAR